MLTRFSVVLEIRKCKKWVERRSKIQISSGNRKFQLPVSNKNKSSLLKNNED
jgi:hypothetical protein